MRTFGDEFKAENRLTAKQVEALDELSGYEPDEVDPATIIPARTLTSLRKRGLADDHGITGVGYDVLAAHI